MLQWNLRKTKEVALVLFNRTISFSPEILKVNPEVL